MFHNKLLIACNASLLPASLRSRLHASITTIGASDVCPDVVTTDLLERVRQHDESASRVLAERLYPLVAKVVHAHLPRMEEAEDLIQEVYMKIFSKLDQHRGDVPFEHWVGRVARTTCIDRLRRRNVRPEWRWSDLSEGERHMLEQMAHEESPPDSDASSALSIIEKMLAKLDPQDAWLIRMVDLQEKELSEVSEATGWKPTTTRVRLFRARKRLKKVFQDIENAQP